ncbi:MAG: hypothetical protein AB7N80_06370 [Bdellovibrionales bacterium]
MSKEAALFFALVLTVLFGSGSAHARSEANTVSAGTLLQLAESATKVEQKVLCHIDDQDIRSVAIYKFHGTFELIEGNEANRYVDPHALSVNKKDNTLVNGLFAADAIPSLTDRVLIGKTKDYEMTLFKRSLDQPQPVDYYVSVVTAQGSYEKMVDCEEK